MYLRRVWHGYFGSLKETIILSLAFPKDLSILNKVCTGGIEETLVSLISRTLENGIFNSFCSHAICFRVAGVFFQSLAAASGLVIYENHYHPPFIALVWLQDLWKMLFWQSHRNKTPQTFPWMKSYYYSSAVLPLLKTYNVLSALHSSSSLLSISGASWNKMSGCSQEPLFFFLHSFRDNLIMISG